MTPRVKQRRRRHCEERSDEAIHSFFTRQDGLLRFARNDGRGSMDCFAEPVIGRAFARRSAMPSTSIFMFEFYTTAKTAYTYQG